MTFSWHLRGEKKGWCTDGATRATSIVANIFMGAALLTIAKESALPNGNLPWIPIKASNLLAGMSTISGLFGAFFQPLVGAIVDHSNKRWHIGYGSVMFLCLMNAIQVRMGVIEQVSDAFYIYTFIYLFFGVC